jgi:alginate O-acetyltransferase complex protein AlgJ
MSAARSRVQKCADLVLIGLFVAAIGLPLAARLTGLDGADGSENRLLKQRPPLRLEATALNQFPAQFEAYYNDQFGFRPLLIRTLSLGRFLLGISTSPQVVIGQGGWLYYTTEQVGRDYATTRPLTPEQLNHWQQALEQRHAWCAARGIRYLFVVAPDKQTIYPEELPAALQRRRVPSRLDQLVDHLRDRDSPVRLIDLRPALWHAKQQEQIYCTHDTHWNDAGAHAAYLQILAVLAEDRPGLEPWPRGVFDEKHIARGGNDLNQMLSLKGFLEASYLRLVSQRPRQAQRLPVELPARGPRRPELNQPFATEHPDQSLPRAIVFRDSFMTALAPFLSEHFRRAIYVWQCEFDATLVEQEKPDFVIQELVERTLVNVPLVPDVPN